MDEFTERRFGHLRELSKDEKLRKIQELEEDIEISLKMIDDRTVPGQEKTELRNDIKYDREVIAYLTAIMDEKSL